MKRSLLLTLAPLIAVSLHAQDPARSRLYALHEVDTPPGISNAEELRAALESTYPPEQRAAGQSARVTVRFVVDVDGVPREVQVVHSTDAAFDSATLASVALLRFAPATVSGKSVAVRVELPVEWEISGVAEAPAPPDADTQDADFVGVGDGDAYPLREVEIAPIPVNPEEFVRELQRLYPRELRSARISGFVRVWFVVDERGEVVSPRVTESSDARFNAATLDAVRVLRYRPGKRDGRAVRTWMELPIQWSVTN